MPLHSSPLYMTFNVKNLSMLDKELKIFKQITCDCSLKRNRMRRMGKVFHCPHKNLVAIRPTSECIKGECSIQLEIICRYELLGRHEIIFSLM